MIFLFIFISFIIAQNFELQVFVVPHSHMDAGWFLTIDDYYSNGVHLIFTSVINQLLK